MKNYTPGQHILCTFECSHDKLTNAEGCRAFFDGLINELLLSKVGEVYHSFDNGGFTAVVCLVESHVSIHTWPEFGLATFDVFLSNFNNDNTDKVKRFHRQTLEYFGATAANTHEISR